MKWHKGWTRGWSSNRQSSRSLNPESKEQETWTFSDLNCSLWSVTITGAGETSWPRHWGLQAEEGQAQRHHVCRPSGPKTKDVFNCIFIHIRALEKLPHAQNLHTTTKRRTGNPASSVLTPSGIEISIYKKSIMKWFWSRTYPNDHVGN